MATRFHRNGGLRTSGDIAFSSRHAIPRGGGPPVAGEPAAHRIERALEGLVATISRRRYGGDHPHAPPDFGLRAPLACRCVTELERSGSGYGGSGSSARPVCARNPSVSSGRYWMRLSSLLALAASSSTVPASRLPRSRLACAHTLSAALSSQA